MLPLEALLFCFSLFGLKFTWNWCFDAVFKQLLNDTR